MTNKMAPGVGDVAQNISQRGIDLVDQTGGWIRGNGIGILIAAVIGVTIAAALLALRSLAARMLRQGSENLHWRIIFARAIARTSVLFIVLCAAELVSEHANTPPALLSLVHVLFVIVASFQAAIWARELILGYVEHRVGPETEGSTLASATGIIRLLVSVTLFAIALVLILDNLGVNVTGLIAGLGIGGIAIGLAAQGIFSDLFAALSIIFDKPFRRGDTIQFDSENGKVEQIGLKTTRIRSVNGEQIVISNANLLGKQLRNFANLKRRRMTVTFGLIHQTPPEVCAGVAGMVRAIVEGQKNAKMIHCGMVGISPSSLDFELVFDVSSSDTEFAFATRSAVCIAMLAEFNEARIRLANPTQIGFTAAPDGSLVKP
jgi:small-conductance mechanosensitive channel